MELLKIKFVCSYLFYNNNKLITVITHIKYLYSCKMRITMPITILYNMLIGYKKNLTHIYYEQVCM